MSSLRQALVFFLLSALFTAKHNRIYGHLLLQLSSSRSEFNCTLTPDELQAYRREEGSWIVAASGIEDLDGDIQSLVNCTEAGDVLLFDVGVPVQPRSRITIPWNLTLSAFVENPSFENGTFPEASRKVTFLCPREDEGVFLVDANESLFANFVFRNCSSNRTREEAPYGIVTTTNCSTSRILGTIGFHHLEFEANFLNSSAALYVQEPSCSSIQIIDITFNNNSCIGTCAASLVCWTEIQNITLTGNRFFEEDVRAPVLIGIHSGSNTTINGLVASGNNGTTVHVENASLSISNSHLSRNSGGLSRNGNYSGGVTLLQSTGQILDCRFEENTGETGSSIFVHNSSTVVRRTRVVGNHVTSQGGGVFITCSSNVSVLDSIIANNSAGLYGGGIYSNVSSSVQIKNTTFETNSAETGGGLYFGYGHLDITNSTFKENAAQDGAGWYCTFGIVSVRASTIIDNSANWFGGGGYIQSSSYSLNNLTVVQNKGTSAGGLIMVDSSGSLNSSHFERNAVSTRGGGVYMRMSEASLVRNCSFVNNSASYGGGIYGDELQLASLLSCRFVRNRATDSGGGACFEHGTYTIEGNSFEENESDDYGGGLSCLDSSLNVSRTTFLRNNASSSGGGSNVDGNMPVWFANCTWRANVVRYRGGGAFFKSVPSAVITTSVFNFNQAVFGGGSYSTEANITLLDVSGNNNTVIQSGAVLYFHQSTGTMSNCMFTRNSAVGGGVFYLRESEASISSSSFVSNEATNNGGAIHCAELSKLTLKNSSFASNSAETDGGAISVSGAIISAANLTFQNNKASRFGGAVFLLSSTSATLSHSVFINETSGHRGGAVFTTGTELSLMNISIASSSAASGGGIYLSWSSANISQMLVTHCEASESGGGIRMVDSKVTGRGLNLSMNTAGRNSQQDSYGGGISIEGSSRLRFRNTAIDGNRAQFGAGIYAKGNCVVVVSSGRFYNNSASTSGGVALVQDSSLTLRRVSCSKSSAFYGGSFHVLNSKLILNDSQLINSSSTDAGGTVLAQRGSNVVLRRTTIQSSIAANGGGIMLTNSTLRCFRVQLLNCSARQHGGGVGLNESSNFLCTNCLFEGNNALREGGALRLESPNSQMLAFQLANTVFRGNDADFGGAIHFQTGDGSADCSDVNSTECTFLALTGCVLTNNHARFAGGAILANNPMAIRISCHPSNKTDSFGYYAPEEFETLSEVSSLDVVCDNWKQNNASAYGPVVGSYVRRTSVLNLTELNIEERTSGALYVLHNHSSGRPLPSISLKAFDEFGQGPAMIQDNQLFEGTATTEHGLFVSDITVRMDLGQGTFPGITPLKKPGNYNIHINFNDRSISRLTIVVAIRKCLIGESIVESGTMCDPCGNDTYNFDILHNKHCSPCPTDASCDSIAIRPKKGFWHKTPCSTHIQRCLSDRACDEEDRDTRLLELGSKIEDCDFDDEFVGNYSEALCREGYTGPLCGSCIASHGKIRSFRCEKCYGRSFNIFVVVSTASILLVLATIQIRGALPAPKPEHTVSRNQSGCADPSSSVNGQMVEMSDEETTSSGLNTQETSPNTPAMQQRQREADLAKLEAMETFKIIINYLQVIAMAIAVNVAWTGALIALFEIAEFIGGMTSETASRSIDCLTSADFSIPRSAVRTIVNLSIPVLVGLFFVVFWLAATIRKGGGFDYLLDRWFLSTSVVSYLSYTAITKNAVNTLYCIEIHDSVELGDDSITKYWAVDTGLKCDGATRTVLAFVCGWPVLILFSLGFPVLIAYVLIKGRNQGPQEQRADDNPGFLYKSYKKEFIFWESVILLRKGALAVIVVFAYPLGGNLQGILAVCVLVVALYFHTLCMPYLSEFNKLNQLEGLSLFISSLTVVSGLFFNDDRTSPEAKAVINASVIVANLGLVIYLFVSLLVAGAAYLRIVLQNEEVFHDQNATSFQIIKIFVKSRSKARFGPFLRRFTASTYRRHEEPIPDEV